MGGHIAERIFSLAARTTLVVICVASFLLMFAASVGDSAIMDELAHIPAGYGYVSALDFRLNPEHPPLVKVLAAFPLPLLTPNFPTGDPAWAEDVNGQWTMGTRFLYESGNDADRLVRLSRIGPILLTILLVLLMYRWAAELLGRMWGLLPSALFALSPHVLAHGHYVTTDVAAAFGVLVATYYFLRFLAEPSRSRLWSAGAAFGLAQLAKFSAVLLVPYFLFLAITYHFAGLARDGGDAGPDPRFTRFLARARRSLGSVILVFFAGYAFIVYPTYAVFTINYPIERQTRDTAFILNSFAGGPTPEGALCKPARCLAEANIWMSANPVTRPFAQYFLGVLMVLQRSAGGNTNYFLGEVSAAGWRHYFPVVYLLKEPLPLLFFVLFGLLLGAARALRSARGGIARMRERFRNYLSLNFAEFSMIVFVLLYWAYSVQSNLNIGFRHLFPALPFTYILAAGAWKRWIVRMPSPSGNGLITAVASWIRTLVAGTLKYSLLVALVVWFVFETVFAAPHFLSYFNEIGGGTRAGYRYVTDSNYDWGQDLLRLTSFVDAHPEIDKIAVHYFGGGNPKYYLGEKVEDWWSARGNPKDAGIRWFAISVNSLQGVIQPQSEPRSEYEYQWLTELRPPKPGMGNVPEPDFRAGTSIFIYHF